MYICRYINMLYLHANFKVFKIMQRGNRKTPVVINNWGKVVKWNPENSHTVYLMALLGATDSQMAEVLDVPVDTINRWKNSHPEFMEALSRGKMKANMKVAESFYHNCIDRWIEEEQVHVWKGKIIKTKVKRFIQGDKWAQTKFLAIKHPEQWSEIHKMNEGNPANSNISINFNILSTDELAMMESIQQKNKQLPENAGSGN